MFERMPLGGPRGVHEAGCFWLEFVVAHIISAAVSCQAGCSPDGPVRRSAMRGPRGSAAPGLGTSAARRSSPEHALPSRGCGPVLGSVLIPGGLKEVVSSAAQALGRMQPEDIPKCGPGFRCVAVGTCVPICLTLNKTNPQVSACWSLSGVISAGMCLQSQTPEASPLSCTCGPSVPRGHWC